MIAIAVYGGRAESVLVALGEAGVHGVKTHTDRVEMLVARKDLHKAIAICEQRCYNYKIIGTAFARAGRKALAFLPLLLTSVIAAALMLASNALVWRVEITGVGGSETLRVRSVLSDMGVRAGMLKSSVDSRGIERALIGVDGIAAASVTIEGSVLTAEVLGGETYGGAAEHADALVSGYDCVITRVVAECGTAVVRPGDVAAKGDVLIEGREYLTADGSPAGETIVRGRAYGRVTFSFSAPLAEAGGLRRTGRSSVVTELGLFGMTVGGSGSPYKHSESVTERSVLYPLPVSVTRTTYYELDGSSFEDETEAFIRERSDELVTLYGADFTPRTVISERGGADVMTIYFTGEICVGEI